MRSILVPHIGHPSGGESDRQYSAVHETEVSAAGLSDDSGRADFLELIENQAEREELGSNALAALDSQRGATGRTVAALVQLMADRRSGDPA